MKNKTIEKLRQKAIHALGGCMPCDVFHKPLGVVNEYTKYPIRIMADGLVSSDAPEELKRMCVEEMAHKVAGKIYRDGLYELRTSETPFGTEYEMIVEIIPLKCGDAQR